MSCFSYVTANPSNAEFTSGICKDAGYSAVGTQVEMVGKLAILAVSAPVVLSLVETLKVFME